MSSDNSVVRTVSKHRHMLSPISANAIFCCNYLDVFLSHIGRIYQQFACRVYQQRVLVPECNKVNLIKELLNIECNFATVYLCLIWLTLFLVLRLYVLNSHFNLCLLFYVV